MSFANHPLMLAHLERHSNDNDVRQIARLMDDHTNPTMRGLFAGCVDEPLACIAALTGYKAIGLDLREYNGGSWTVPECEFAPYDHRIMDLLSAKSAHFASRDNPGTFDFAVAISAIEHFGLSEFGGIQDPCGDVWAMRKLWELLRPGGLAFITLPEGGTWHECPNWRRYTKEILRCRIIGPFEVLTWEHWWTSIAGNGEATEDDLANYDTSADLSAVLVLKKGKR